MTDQWLPYQVFKQEREGAPFRNVGSVHAADAEMALLAARDVFARRPACNSLWVVPAAVILARTAEELVGERGRKGAGEQGGGGAGEQEDSVQYAVFSKQSDRQAMTYVEYVGEIAAGSPEEALRRAVEAAGAPALVWWVCPAAAIARSGEDDIPGLAAATSKLFRLPNQYHTVVTMRQLRRGEEGNE
ncbi:putative enzyme of phenylacetate metabolism [Candidatus Promineifilum breve]|uniref:Enzyme of phenylacetate metabolism n=1 Tax=Candidatus Promineifilum breve TaxID=1806508 RepID=A0A160SZH3_9CHLR|nr:phenylacetic acid degradation protein [Candidatus Promineifilum breve]CUS02806.2 putative enzyme of phenylacetate metabolism [Candidatus Promineifilum breve]